MRVRRDGSFTFPLGGPPGLNGNVRFHSVAPVNASRKRRITLVKRAFTIPASGVARLRIKLSRKNLKILRRNRKIKTRAVVTLNNNAGLSSSARKLVTFRAPR